MSKLRNDQSRLRAILLQLRQPADCGCRRTTNDGPGRSRRWFIRNTASIRRRSAHQRQSHSQPGLRNLHIFFPASIAAIILGHISLSEIRRSAGRLGGRGLATTGLVLGYLGLMVIPIMIVAAIAIPNLLRARIAANEASAVGSLRTINVAAVQYAAGYENGFPSSFEVFGYGKTIVGNCNHGGLIDRRLASGQKSGYIFTYTPQFPNDASGPVVSPKAAARGCTSGGASGFTVAADPLQRGTTGVRSFFTDQTGVIRYSANGESATADSPPLQ